MTPGRALRTATTMQLSYLEKKKNSGRLRPAYFADLVAVEGDPLADINVALTMCAGS